MIPQDVTSAEDYNKRVIQALEQAQAALGIRSAAAFARRLATRSGGPPDISTYQRWLRGESLIPAWALVAAAEEVNQGVDVLLGISQSDTNRLSTFQTVISTLQAQMNEVREQLGLQLTNEPATTTPDGRPIVASAIIVRDGRVLMTKRRWPEGPLRWNYITGQVEPGESPEQAAIREVREEVGLDVAIERKLGERVHPSSGRYMIYFACQIISTGEPHVVDHEENAEVRWATLDEAAKLLVPTGGIWEPVREYIKQAVAATAHQRQAPS